MNWLKNVRDWDDGDYQLALNRITELQVEVDATPDGEEADELDTLMTMVDLYEELQKRGLIAGLRTMTPDQEQIVQQFGLQTIEVFNIARGHTKTASPCTCRICRDIYDKLAQRLKYINITGNAGEP